MVAGQGAVFSEVSWKRDFFLFENDNIRADADLLCLSHGGDISERVAVSVNGILPSFFFLDLK